MGFRWGESGAGHWNLDLAASAGTGLPDRRRDRGGGAAPLRHRDTGVLRRGVPARRVARASDHDGVRPDAGPVRGGQTWTPGQWPAGYDDADEPYTPAWQEPITGVPAPPCARIAREFADNADRSGGRSMILMGAGTNHWFHSDTTYRAMLALTTLTGCQGVNGGGWAHYVGQEKCRPVTGWAQLAFGLDWSRPPRQMISTAYWYLHTDQWRYDSYDAGALALPAGHRPIRRRAHGRPAGPVGPAGLDADDADVRPQPARRGRRGAGGRPGRPGRAVAGRSATGALGFAGEDPDAPENWPRVLTVWRANLLGSSAKGNEYFLRHLLGTDASLRASETPPEHRPRDVRWREEAPEGKLDLLLWLDFRMTSTTLFSDIVLPAATWYEKHDLSSTDMHPFVHAFNPAIAPPWQTRTDFDAFHGIAAAFSAWPPRTWGPQDVVAMPLTHDTPDELATPGGVVRDWRAGESAGPAARCRSSSWWSATSARCGEDGRARSAAGPARDHHQGGHRRRDAGGRVPRPASTGPSTADPPTAGRAWTATCTPARPSSRCPAPPTAGSPWPGFEALERRTGTRLVDLAAEHEGKQIRSPTRRRGRCR